MMIKKLLLILLVIVVSASVALIAYSVGSDVVDEPLVQWVSHTEYWQDDYASTIVRITDYKGRAYNIDRCEAMILKPDKTILTDDAPMTQSGITGNWYRTDSLVGQLEGTYEQEVTCFYELGDQEETIKTSQSFHLNPALNYIKVIDDNLIATGSNLENLSFNIQGQIVENEVLFTSQINQTNTDLNTLINTIGNQLSSELANHDVSSEAQLSNVNLSLTASILQGNNEIKSQLSGVNGTIVTIVNDVRSDILGELKPYVEYINQTTEAILEDSEWIVLNAMNQADKVEIDQRFTTLDNNLAILSQFCSNVQTQNSDLCQEIDSIQNTIDILRTEQTQYYEDLDETTTGTFNLLSGSVVENIDEILLDLGFLKDVTVDINTTVNSIREDQISEVRMVVIS
jgi:hypothetical protein